MKTINILAGSVERDGSFIPTITVNGESRYFTAPAGLPSHVHFDDQLHARQYAELRATDLHRTVMYFLQESGFITPPV